MIQETKSNLIVSRTFEAPSELVFEAWTNPDRLVRWLGAMGYTAPYCSIDLRPGGLFAYQLRDPNGREIRFKGFYREIEPARKLVFTNGVVDENGDPAPHPDLPDWPRETVVTVTFEENDGKTKIDLVQSVETGTEAEFEAFGIGRSGAKRLWSEEFERLAENITKG